MKLTLLFLLLAPFVVLGAVTKRQTPCKCLPSSNCWPTTDEWTSFSQRLSRPLITVTPPASPCHDPNYDRTACTDVTTNWRSSLWRSNQPSAMQFTNFEESPALNASCLLSTPREAPCAQGRIPSYAVAAQTPGDIQEAVNFARTRNLKLVIKNTGHDFLGRSTAAGSLSVWTHNMKNITGGKFTACGANEDSMTIGAGVQGIEVYTAADQAGRTVLAAYSPTVGTAGGYIQGGGHSVLGVWKGLASDHALQFTVVVPDGRHVTANSCTNSDLFWALRGGGGGTFGIVTSVTFSTFPDVPVVGHSLSFNVPTQSAGVASDTYWELVEAFHSTVPALSDVGVTGFYYITPNPTGNNRSTFSFSGMIVNKTAANNAAITAAFAPFRQRLDELNISYNFALTPYPSVSNRLRSTMEASVRGSGTGFNQYFASRLISRELLLDSAGVKRFVDTLKSIDWPAGRVAHGDMTAGGAVATNGDIVDSAVNPAWRRAGTHFIWQSTWDDSISAESKAEIARDLSAEVEKFMELEPDMGAYLNEADPNQPDFGYAFWGDHYPRLKEIKNKWDPEGLLVCNPCVGAEEWDRDGVCRI